MPLPDDFPEPSASTAETPSVDRFLAPFSMPENVPLEGVIKGFPGRTGEGLPGTRPGNTPSLLAGARKRTPKPPAAGLPHSLALLAVSDRPDQSILATFPNGKTGEHSGRIDVFGLPEGMTTEDAVAGFQAARKPRRGGPRERSASENSLHGEERARTPKLRRGSPIFLGHSPIQPTS